MIKLFNRWDVSGIKVEDPGLEAYINLKPIIVPRTGGRNAKWQFAKTKNPVVERLITHVMIPGHRSKKHKISSGHMGGKGALAYKIVEQAFIMIERALKKNPVEVFIKALENAAPREEINTIEYGGARYPQAVEMAPQRRVDFALRQLTHGAYDHSFKSKKPIADALADEIIKAYNFDMKSAALAKKLELERQADAAR